MNNNNNTKTNTNNNTTTMEKNVKIKISFAGDIRLLQTPLSTFTSMQNLTRLIEETFDRFTPEEYLLKWRDQEKDQISLSKDEDLTFILETLPLNESHVRLTLIKARGGESCVIKRKDDKKEKEDTKAPEEIRHQVRHPAICDHCRTHITGIRWKCVHCPDYDLCSACEGLPDRENLHKKDHWFVKLTESVWPQGFPLIKESESQPIKPFNGLCGMYGMRRYGCRRGWNPLQQVKEEEEKKQENEQVKEEEKEKENEQVKEEEEEKKQENEQIKEGEKENQEEQDKEDESKEEVKKMIKCLLVRRIHPAYLSVKKVRAEQVKTEEEEGQDKQKEEEEEKKKEGFEEEIKVLSAMGFTKEEVNKTLLELHKGDLQKVVSSLLVGQ